MTTRIARQARDIARTEAEAGAERIARVELAVALDERTAPGIAPISPVTLMTLFGHNPARTWELLAGLTRSQLVNQAIETACWLEATGIEVRWGSILERWERRLAELAAPVAA